MTVRVKVSSKHQIAVPASVRHQLAIQAGDRLVVEVQDGVMMVIPEPPDPISDLKGLGREVWDGMDAQEYVDQERDGW